MNTGQPRAAASAIAAGFSGSACQDRAWLAEGRWVHSDVEPSAICADRELERSARAVVAPDVEDRAYALLEKCVALGEVTPESHQVGVLES